MWFVSQSFLGVVSYSMGVARTWSGGGGGESNEESFLSAVHFSQLNNR